MVLSVLNRRNRIWLYKWLSKYKKKMGKCVENYEKFWLVKSLWWMLSCEKKVSTLRKPCNMIIKRLLETHDRFYFSYLVLSSHVVPWVLLKKISFCVRFSGLLIKWPAKWAEWPLSISHVSLKKEDMEANY